jgi:hypothetical protein
LIGIVTGMNTVEDKMKEWIRVITKGSAVFCYLFGAVALVASISLALVYRPALAQEGEQPQELEQTPTSVAPACSPPGDWGRTVRLFYLRQTTTDWTIEVDDPEMEVTLEFFYYQDYDPSGCPFDCVTHDCQLDEVGTISSPFGEAAVEDNTAGGNRDTVRQSGILTQGTYRATFTLTGQSSINIGLKVHKRAVPTPTLVPPATATPTFTPTPTEDVLPPLATATNTPVVPGDTATPTVTSTPAAGQPPVNPTATATATSPSAPTETSQPPVGITATPTEIVSGPRPRNTATATLPATLAPPAGPVQTGQPSVLIPNTGADFSLKQALVTDSIAVSQRVLGKLAVALLGLALIFHGLNSRLK